MFTFLPFAASRISLERTVASPISTCTVEPAEVPLISCTTESTVSAGISVPGFDGSSGLEGSSGLDGSSGSTGFSGSVGSSGSTGFSGSDGSVAVFSPYPRNVRS
ncbi:hypothetical protein H6A32_03030 [Drancourtella massiliensis]|uniref:Collagen-like protein n=1 Tax=Drancourtella massiliensis TaxID=1632013 RepID=A0ABS2EEA8_9FIRM|nr:hypothetical protein [Drancourtella massiliensis]